jgi:hypothetical protein
MSDVFAAIKRFRADAGALLTPPIQLEKALTHCYPVSCILVSGLCIDAIRDFLQRHRGSLPPGLHSCRDRNLRGGIVAWGGFGFIFADLADSESEIRFTLAHEAKHFLQDHLYPRLDLLARFGPEIQPVLDGYRSPTRAESIDALLARADLVRQTHFLDRNAILSPELEAIEADADAFACELLAPAAQLHARFPQFFAGQEAVTHIEDALVREFGLPAAPARNYARAWVAEHGGTHNLLHRLGLA